MKIKIIMFGLMAISITTFAQHDHAASSAEKTNDQIAVTFKDASLGTVYQQYTILKDALVASNAVNAKRAATNLQKSLASIKNGTKANAAAKKIATTDKLADQREAFSTLSDEVASLIRGGQLSAGTIYREYCPMANGGSYWLSNEKAIKNPYFGDEMLTCGSVKETIH